MNHLVLSQPYYFTDKTCGYCKHITKDEPFPLRSIGEAALKAAADPPSSITMGFFSHAFSPDVYDRLINLGFRRSGHFTYKSDNLRNCCRMYTIRTAEVPNAKEHRHAINRFIRNIGVEAPPPKAPGNYSLSLARETHADRSRFYTRFEPALYSDEKYALYCRYQTHIHQDTKNTKKGFEKFLCESPFMPETLDDAFWLVLNGAEGPLTSFGPVHECYYINGKLAALAVLDVLPSGVSSVYFLWDPEYASWGLGTISGLREFALTRRLGLKYYYLGYYIADCHKMRYKAKFGGEILDLATHRFWDLTKVDLALSSGGLVAMAEGPASSEASEDPEASEPSTMSRGEFELDFAAQPLLAHAAHPRDFGEAIYGTNSAVYAKAERYAGKLTQEYGLGYTDTANNPLFHTPGSHPTPHINTLPFVVPGILPLWQVYAHLSEDNHHRRATVMLFDEGKVRAFDWEAESVRVRHIVVDTARLLGWKLAGTCVIDITNN